MNGVSNAFRNHFQERYALPLFAVLYLLFARAGLFFVIEPEKVASLWPVSGLALAVLALVDAGERYKYLAAIFFANTLANLLGGNPLPASLGFAVANTAEAALAVWTLCTVCKSVPDFTRMRDLTGMVCAALFANGLTAFFGAAVPFFAFGAPFLQTWELWWIADGLGMMLVGSCILAWRPWKRLLTEMSRRQWQELLSLLLLITLMTLSIFGLVPPEYRLVERPYWILAAIVPLAIRTGSGGVLLGILAIALLSLHSIGLKGSISPWQATTHLQAMLQFQGYLAVMMVSGLSISLALSERRIIEKRLKESHELFEAFLRHSPIYAFIKEVAPGRSTVIQASNNYEQMIGISGSKMLGKTMEALFPPDFAAKITADDWAVATGGKELRLEETLNGRHYETIKFPIVQKERTLLAGYTIDVTDRRRAEILQNTRMELLDYAATHSLEELLQQTLDRVEELVESPIGFYHFVDPDEKALTLQAWSTRTVREFCTAAGKGSHYGIDQAGVWVDCVHERKTVIHNDYPSLPHRKGLPEGHAAVKREMVVPIMRSGRVVAILGVGNKPTDYDDRDRETVAYLADVAWEITEHKRAEEQIRQSEARYRNIFNHSPVAIWEEDFSAVKERFLTLRASGVTDFRHYFESRPEEVARLASLVRIVNVNEASREILGFADMDQLIRELPRYFTAESLQVFKEELIALEAGKLSFNSEIPVLNAQGEKRILDLSLAVTDESTATLERVLVTFTDISDRKRAEVERLELESRLRRSEKMEALGQLAGGVAHDLNNVLGVSMVYAEMMQENIEADTRLKKYAEGIFSSTVKAAAIIQDLLTMTRRGVSVLEVVDLNRMVSNVMESNEYGVIRNFHPSVDFHKEICGEPLPISGSQVHLEKTILNLLSNATESISGRGVVTLKTERQYLDKPVHGYDEVKEGEYAVVIVEDTGGGIPKEDLNRIFEPFFTKKKMGRSGTGLGLAIVWGTVKDHQGYIDVESESGKGTKFSLYFPVTTEKMSQETEKVPVEEYLGHGESVLVADDVAGQREIALEILTQLNYKATTVSSGEEAVAHLEANRADMVILDMIMDPGIDGLETYRRIRRINPNQKAIIVSGFSETERVREALALGVGTYVRKPYYKEKIGIAVKRELERV